MVDESPETSCDEAEILLEHGGVHGGNRMVKKNKDRSQIINTTLSIEQLPFIPK